MTKRNPIIAQMSFFICIDERKAEVALYVLLDHKVSYILVDDICTNDEKTLFTKSKC